MTNIKVERDQRSTVTDVARRAGLSYEQGRAFVEAIFEELQLGREVRLQGLGVFRITELAARRFKTPVVPGGVADVPQRKVIRFRSAPTAQQKLKEN